MRPSCAGDAARLPLLDAATGDAAVIWTEPLEILLVEDDEQQASLVRELLEAVPLSTIRCTWADEFEGALQLLRTRQFDAALVDYHLGGRKGVELVRAARRNGCDIPYIILTADPDSAVDAAALEEGVADFLQKIDVTPEALDRALRYAIRHHRALALLRHREEHFRALIQNLSDAILLWDASGTIRFASESFGRLSGVPLAEVVGRNAFEGVHPEDAPLLRRRFEECVREPRSRVVTECRFRHFDGSWRDQEIVAVNRLDDPSVRAVVVTFHDITERKRAEHELRRKVDQLNAIVSHIPMSVWAVDRAGIVTFAEGRVLQRFGTAPTTLQGCALVDAWSHHADLAASTRRALDGEEVHDTLRLDGGVYEIWYTPLRDDEGVLSGAIGVAVEVSDRVRLEEELRQSQKIEAIGRLAGGVAHDFNNLLTAIIGYTDLALERDSTENAAERLEAIQRAANTAAGLTRQLLAFSRRQLLQPRPLDLNVVITAIEPLIRRLIGEDITLVTALESNLPSVNADPHQIEQIVMNLAVNARDAMPHGGRLALSTRQVQLDADFVTGHRGAKEGPHVLLSVTDSGEGMSAEVRDRLFEPFFTTKERGRGTGLGLATVYGIVKQSDGYIWVTSEAGQGTTFDIYLPVSSQHAEVSTSTPAPPDSYGGTETILVVDDQEEVRSISCEILRSYGYRVLHAAGPAEALALASVPGAAIDLLFTDVVMPEMSGRELARRLRMLRPNLRVVYTSGYTSDAMGEDHIVTSGVALLAKPFTAKALASKIREALNAATPPAV